MTLFDFQKIPLDTKLLQHGSTVIAFDESALLNVAQSVLSGVTYICLSAPFCLFVHFKYFSIYVLVQMNTDRDLANDFRWIQKYCTISGKLYLFMKT